MDSSFCHAREWYVEDTISQSKLDMDFRPIVKCYLNCNFRASHVNASNIYVSFGANPPQRTAPSIAAKLTLSLLAKNASQRNGASAVMTTKAWADANVSLVSSQKHSTGCTNTNIKYKESSQKQSTGCTNTNIKCQEDITLENLITIT